MSDSNLPLSETELPLADGVKVILADDFNNITSYTLAEQGDWFEVELPWMRQWLKPGMRMLDIGANHGIYALSAAKAVGANGKVWAIEPTPLTFNRLTQSKERNGFEQMTLLNYALSSAEGELKFYISSSSELNSLVADSPDQESITVTAKTLDSLLREHDITNVDFLKIDAEGEEAKILEGATEFFAQNDPLIMFELQHGKEINLPLIENFQARGFDCYYLIPRLQILAPCGAKPPLENRLLNLYACRPERAKKLAASGHLLLDMAAVVEETPIPTSVVDAMSIFPYASGLNLIDDATWSSATAGGAQYLAALQAYLQVRADRKPSAKRYALIRFAYQKTKEALAEHHSLPRLATLSRLAFELGEVHFGLKMANHVIHHIQNNPHPDLKEPFLLPARDFDFLTPNQKGMIIYLFSSAVHEGLLSSCLSLQFVAEKPVQNLNALKNAGYLLPRVIRYADAMLAKEQKVSVTEFKEKHPDYFR